MIFNNTYNFSKFCLNVKLLNELQHFNLIGLRLFILIVCTLGLGIFSGFAQSTNFEEFSAITEVFFKPMAQNNYKMIKVKSKQSGEIIKFTYNYATDTNFQTDCVANRLSGYTRKTGHLGDRKAQTFTCVYKQGDLFKYVESGVPKPAYDYMVNKANKVYESNNNNPTSQDYFSIALNPFNYFDQLGISFQYHCDTSIDEKGKQWIKCIDLFGFPEGCYNFSDNLWTYSHPSLNAPVFKLLPPDQYSRIFNLVNPARALQKAKYYQNKFNKVYDENIYCLLFHGHFTSYENRCSFNQNSNLKFEIERLYKLLKELDYHLYNQPYEKNENDKREQLYQEYISQYRSVDKSSFILMYDLFGNGSKSPQIYSLESDAAFLKYLRQNFGDTSLRNLLNQVLVDDFWIALDTQNRECEIYKEMKSVSLPSISDSALGTSESLIYRCQFSQDFELTNSSIQSKLIPSLVDSFLLQGRMIESDKLDTPSYTFMLNYTLVAAKIYAQAISQLKWRDVSVKSYNKVSLNDLKEIKTTKKKRLYYYKGFNIKVQQSPKHNNHVKSIVISKQEKITPKVIYKQKFKYYKL